MINALGSMVVTGAIEGTKKVIAVGFGLVGTYFVAKKTGMLENSPETISDLNQRESEQIDAIKKANAAKADKLRRKSDTEELKRIEKQILTLENSVADKTAQKLPTEEDKNTLATLRASLADKSENFKKRWNS